MNVLQMKSQIVKCAMKEEQLAIPASLTIIYRLPELNVKLFALIPNVLSQILNAL